MESMLVNTSRGAAVRVYAGGEGASLVYLHGVTGLMPDDPFLAALSQQFKVYAPVLPGYEDSGGEEFLDQVLSFALHTSDVIDALGLQTPVLAGHCMGGMIASEMAAIAPREFSHLVLIGALGLWDDAKPVPDLFASLPFELPGLLFNDAQLGERLLGSGMDLNDPEFLTEFLVGNAKRMGMAGRLLFPIPDRGLARRLYRVRAPTTLIWGDNDRLTPVSYAEMFAGALPHAEVKVFAGGHMVHYESTQAVVDEIVKATAA